MMKTRSGKTLSENGEGVPLKTDNNNDKQMNRTFYIIFFSLILDLLAFTVILPLLPSLLEHYSHHDESGLYSAIKNSVSSFRNFVGAPDTARWNSVLFGGLIGSLFSMLQFLTSPIIGAASDVYGRRPLMLICLIGISFSYVLWALSQSFLLFVIARIFGGISKGNVSLCTAIVTDVSTPQKRGKGMALIGIAFSIGFVFGPTIGAAFSRLNREEGNSVFFVMPALFALVLSVADFAFMYLYLSETLPSNKRLKSKRFLSQAAEYINPLSLFRFSSVSKLSANESTAVQSIGSIYFIYLFIYSGLEFTLPFLMHNRFEYTSMQQGKMFFFIGTVMALVQGGYTRRVTSGKEAKTAMRGILILIPSFILMAFVTNTVLMYTALTLFSFASATVVPCMTTLISTYGGDDEKGTIMGIFRSLGALSRAVGPVLASTVYWCFGAHVCYIMGAVFLIIPLAQIAKQQHCSKPE
ncbi:major facilitator superfamily domain-containing protein 10 isoform X2 [Aplysia californica]|nr:major facilitator superfamily domain-containing protein 10 isoform X2 [Aplysia californica]